MLHLFLKEIQDTGNCRSAWVIPGQLFFVTPGKCTWGSAGVHWIRRQLCPPYKRCLFIIKSPCGTSSAGTPQEDCARQKATTGGSRVHTACWKWSQEQHTPSHSQDLSQVLLVAPKQEEPEVIYNFALTPFMDQHSTSLTSATMFSRAEEPLCWPCRQLYLLSTLLLTCLKKMVWISTLT